MGQIRLPFIGTVSSDLTTRFNVSLVGSGQALNDASDATYAVYTGGGGAVDSTVATVGHSLPSLNYQLLWRVKTTLGVGEQFNVYIEQFGGGGVLAQWQFDTSAPATAAGGWLTGVMDILDPDNLSITLEGSTLPSGSVEMLGPGTRYVYEAEFVVKWPSIAPPCRNIKRGDRLDLGGARNYPPSKMQQTSSRGVGAY